MQMADVKWIKIVTDIFDDEKIRFIETMPNGDEMIVIWLRLLCLCGKSNNGGLLMMTDKIAYTDEMLASIFNRDVKSIQMALTTFEKLDMIEIINNAIYITNWEKHQSLDKLEHIKNQRKEINARYYQKRKHELENKTSNKITENVLQDTIDKDIDIDNKNKKENILSIAPSKNEPVVISLILNDKSEYPIYQSDIDEWKNLYQSVDILQEIKKMKGWLDANPKKRKTKSGIKRFINSWLSREQDKPHMDASNTTLTKITAFDV